MNVDLHRLAILLESLYTVSCWLTYKIHSRLVTSLSLEPETMVPLPCHSFAHAYLRICL